MTFGSCFGIVTWSARMQSLSDNFKGNELANPDLVARIGYLVSANSGHAVFIVSYAVEFLCSSLAQLLVLDRY
jgi:hypothetical protein